MSYPLLDVFLTMMFFFLWMLWLYLLAKVITDIFRSQDLSGWGKAGWLAFAIVLPFVGVFAYLVARGGDMAYLQARPVPAGDSDYERRRDEVLSGRVG